MNIKNVKKSLILVVKTKSLKFKTSGPSGDGAENGEIAEPVQKASATKTDCGTRGEEGAHDHGPERDTGGTAGSNPKAAKPEPQGAGNQEKVHDRPKIQQTLRRYGAADVYWEAQADDAMCGMHAINGLLQRAAATRVIMHTVAQTLDEEE